ncbi:MAG: sigma-70 family RNA polymerase sigma factor, partial [Acutalibacteraceae bacterium]|nr:sigma-70 family RNA polymerase sigma factor [Acutalibacteraceae bacterium]
MNNQTEQLLEYAEYLYGAALNLCKNEQEATDIVQETYLAAIKTLKSGGKIDNIKPWLLTVLKRRFYDKLRHNYSVTYVNIDAVPEIADERDEYLAIEKSEEAKAVRRALSMLCSTYRHVMVGYYVDNKSIKQLSRELSLPENTVKSRLNLGRKQMKKEITMNKSYTNQSYSPKHICIGMSGRAGLNNEPQSLVKHDDLLTQNILYYAYDEPKTETEIAKALGVSVGYIEPVVNRLVEGELMKRSGGKVYTD